jgi:hypothetical protein
MDAIIVGGIFIAFVWGIYLFAHTSFGKRFMNEDLPANTDL